MKNRPAIAVSGLHRGENPQPGAAVIASLRRRFPGLRLGQLLAMAMAVIALGFAVWLWRHGPIQTPPAPPAAQPDSQPPETEN